MRHKINNFTNETNHLITHPVNFLLIAILATFFILVSVKFVTHRHPLSTA